MIITLASAAEYFRMGIEIGLLEPAAAQAWADATILSLPSPPFEVIEVAWSKGVSDVLSNLATVPGVRDTALAGGWLLGHMREMEIHDEKLARAVSLALRICVAASLELETYYRFDLVDVELSLARMGIAGSIAECRDDFNAALSAFPMPPLQLRSEPNLSVARPQRSAGGDGEDA